MSIILAPLTGYILKASDNFQKDLIRDFRGLLGGGWEGLETSWALDLAQLSAFQLCTTDRPFPNTTEANVMILSLSLSLSTKSLCSIRQY